MWPGLVKSNVLNYISESKWSFLPEASLITTCSWPLAFSAYGSLRRGLVLKATALLVLISYKHETFKLREQRLSLIAFSLFQDCGFGWPFSTV